MKTGLVLLSIILNTLICGAQLDNLRGQIANYCKTKKADIGVALMRFDTGDTLTVGNEKHYPTQSVYKFHLALAILNMVDQGKLSLDQKIPIGKKDLKKNTWSPIREKYPKGIKELTLSDLLTYTVSHSDNNGCDILFRLAGGTGKVEEFIRSIGIKDISIKATEDQMHKNPEAQFTNWTTPYAAVHLLRKFWQENILSAKSREFLWNAMINTDTGPKRLKGNLPKNVAIAHKTGTWDSDGKNMAATVNDIGIVILPNGKRFAIAVFVTQSSEDFDKNEQIIADISKMVWDQLSGK